MKSISSTFVILDELSYIHNFIGSIGHNFLLYCIPEPAPYRYAQELLIDASRSTQLFSQRSNPKTPLKLPSA